MFDMFKKKDKFGVFQFLKEVKELDASITKQRSSNVETKIEDVRIIIDTIKKLYMDSTSIILNLEQNKSIKDKNKTFMVKLLSEKMKNLEVLNKKCIDYESELMQYETLGVKVQKPKEDKK